MTTTETIYCSRHPKEETALTCASCGTPICPRCMVSTPVGMKCPDCGRLRKTALYQIRPERFALAGLVSLIAGMGTVLIGEIGFLAIFVASAYGYFVGMVILKASGMKRGLKLEILAGAGMVIGAFALKILPWMLFAKAYHHGIAFGLGALVDPFFWVALVITTGSAVSRIRYL